MFENLTNKLETIFSKLKTAPSLNEEQVDAGLKEIRLALLEADVALSVAKEFIEKIRPKAIGQEIIRSTSPGQMIVKIVHDELVNFLGDWMTSFIGSPEEKEPQSESTPSVQQNSDGPREKQTNTPPHSSKK